MNGNLFLTGSQSVVGRVSGTAAIPLTVYASTASMPVRLTWSVGPGNALTLASEYLCIKDNTLYADVSGNDASCQRVQAQAQAGAVMISTTTRQQFTGSSTPTGPVWVSNGPPTSTISCALPAPTSLIQNPSFEAGTSPDLAPWVCSGSGATCRVSQGTYGAHQGSRVGLFTQVSNNGMTISQPFDLSCVPYNKQVSVSIWVKPISLDTIECCGKFCSMSIYWDGFQTTNYGAYKPLPNDDGTYDWINHVQTVPSNQRVNNLRVNWNCPGTFLVDDITVSYS